MFKQRAISAVILVIIAAITLYFGGAFTCLVMCAVSLIGVMELLRIYGLNKKGLGYAAYGATVFYYALLYFDLHQFILPLIASICWSSLQSMCSHIRITKIKRSWRHFLHLYM